MIVNIGDKIWANYGKSVVVGNIVDVSPNDKLIFISQLDCETYSLLKESNDFHNISGYWYEVKFLEILDYKKKIGLHRTIKKSVGFNG